MAKISLVAPPLLELTPSSLIFAPQPLGTTSAVKKVRLSNAGTKALDISGIAASGDFAQTNDCPSTVVSTGFCTLSVTFSPTVAGTRTGAVAIADNAPGSPQQLPLTGTNSIPVVSLTATSLTLASQAVGTTSL